jgi:hypothetical protein
MWSIAMVPTAQTERVQSNVWFKKIHNGEALPKSRLLTGIVSAAKETQLPVTAS